MEKKNRKKWVTLQILEISPARPDNPLQPIVMKFCIEGHISKIMKCAEFGVDRVIGLRSGEGSQNRFPIEKRYRL